MARICSTVSILAVLSCVLGAPRIARAQDAPPATADQHTEGVADPSAVDEDVRLQITAGASGTYGNARNVAFNLASLFQLRLGQHAFLAELGWVYGLAAAREGVDPMPHEFGEPDENTNNLTARVRYDIFLTPEDALFVVARVRRDPFARLLPRFGAQAGYLRNLFREENHRFWGEVGYDFTYDNFGKALQIGVDDAGLPVTSDDRSLHSLRLFLGYENRLNEVLTYTTGFEALMRLDRPEHWRFEWINQFRSKVEEWLQISVDITGRFDSLPPGQLAAWDEQGNQPTQMFDLIATLNLVGTFDLHDPPSPEEPEEEEECECPAPECPTPDAGASPEADPSAQLDATDTTHTAESPVHEEPSDATASDEASDAGASDATADGVDGGEVDADIQ